MNKRTNYQILDAVAGDFIPDQTDLTHQVMAKIHLEKRTERLVRVNSTILLFVMLAILLMIASVPGIASAMRQLFGFIPGVGITDPSEPMRVLQEAVSMERTGVTLTVEQVFALPDRTVIQFKVSGIPQSAYPKYLPGSDPQGYQNACVDPLFLRLPDGTALTNTGYNALAGRNNVPEYEARFTLEPVPADVEEVMLVMPCIEGTEQDAVPGVWELPLRLVAATRDDESMAKVHELSAPAPARSETSAETVLSLPASDVGQLPDSDIHLSLEKIVVLPDGDQLYGRLQWAESAPYSVVNLDSFEMTGPGGERIPLMAVSPDHSMMPVPGDRFVPLAFKLAEPIRQPGPITLTADRLTASIPVRDTRFVFDTGAEPYEGQQWIPNQEIRVGEHALRLVSVTRLADGYDFSIQSDPEVGCVDLYIQGAHHQRGVCGQAVTKVQYDKEIPSGILTVVIANLEVRLSGSWQATWTPPEAGQDMVTQP